METRREFVKSLGSVAAATLVASPVLSRVTSGVSSKHQQNRNIRIGIIGAECSHTAYFGKVFNIEKKFPGLEVKYVWGETKDLAVKAMEKGQIPNMVKDPLEMLGKIDALIVDHRHPKYHLEAASPFIKAGIPTFIDKPFCYRLSEGKQFLKMARKLGTPVTSYSSRAHSYATFNIKSHLQKIDKVNNVVSYGPADLDSKYGNIFFYGVHLLQPLMVLFGDDIEKVKVTRNGSKGTACLKFKNGIFATLVLRSLSYGWNTFIETADGVMELRPDELEADPPKALTDMVEMFRTGKEPRSHASILKCVAALEALEKSSFSEKWVEVETV